MHSTFSIITVVKNNPEGLRQTLNSIFEQSYADVQTIVIDGLSTDDTPSVCSEFPDIDIFVSEADSGIYDAMNKGIAYAKNDWILFLNAEDVFYNPQVLENINKHIQINQDSQIICGQTIEVFLNQEIIRCTKNISDLPIHMPACHQSILIKTELLKQYLFDTQYFLCGDLDLICRLLRDNKKLSFYPAIISRVVGVGASNKQWRLTMEERSRIQQSYYNTDSHKKTLQKYHRHIKTKKFIRSLMPTRLQLLLRPIFNRKNQ